MSDRDMWLRVMLRLLFVSYAAAGALAPIAPFPALIALSLLCYLITFPYFIIQLFTTIWSGLQVSLGVLLWTLLCPPFVFVGLFLNFATIVMRLEHFFKRLHYVVVGVVLYSVLLIPWLTGLTKLLESQTWPVRILVCVAAGIACVLMLQFFLGVTTGYPLPRAEAAAVILGYGSFLTITVVLVGLSIAGLAHHAVDGGMDAGSHDGDSI